MDINDILSVKYKLSSVGEKGPVIHGTLKKTGVPVLFSKKAYENENIINVVSRMIKDHEGHPWSIFRTYTKDVVVTSTEIFKPVILHPKREVNSWDMYTATVHNDSVTYVFKNKKDFLNTLKNIEKLSDNYTYKTVLDIYDNYIGLIERLKHQKSNVVFTISLYDIKAFSPIYVEDKADSIGIAVEVMDLCNSITSLLPAVIQGYYILLSNHKENLFYMDGVTIQPYSVNISLDYQVSVYTKVFDDAKNKKSSKAKVMPKAAERPPEFGVNLYTEPVEEFHSGDFKPSWNKYRESIKSQRAAAKTIAVEPVAPPHKDILYYGEVSAKRAFNEVVVDMRSILADIPTEAPEAVKAVKAVKGVVDRNNEGIVFKKKKSHYKKVNR